MTYKQFLRDLRVQAQAAQRRVLSRRTASIDDPDLLGDLATVGAYLFAYKDLEGEEWNQEMLRRFPRLDPEDLPQIYQYGRKLYRKSLPNAKAQEAIREYNKKYKIPPYQHREYMPVDEPVMREIAGEFEKLPEGPVDPNTPEGQRALKSYAVLNKEVEQQFEHLPIDIDPWQKEGQPYANSREMMHDVVDNNHMWVFLGGDPHPMMNEEQTFKFRAVHDYYAHAAHGFEFGPRGEENAWLAHRQMFSPEAWPALTNETRGQNSWVNFGPHAEHNRKNPADTIYAPQKVYMLPEHYSQREHPPFKMSHKIQCQQGHKMSARTLRIARYLVQFGNC